MARKLLRAFAKLKEPKDWGAKGCPVHREARRVITNLQTEDRMNLLEHDELDEIIQTQEFSVTEVDAYHVGEDRFVAHALSLSELDGEYN